MEIQAASPWLDKVVMCLKALSEDEPRNISQVAEATGTSRNVVAAVLNACANFSLVEVSFDGRSEQFALTFKAVMYLRILRSEFQPVVQCIQDILFVAKNREPKTEVDPEQHFMRLIRESTDDELPPYFKLQAIAEAFSLAGNRFVRGSIENRVFGEISARLKEGSSIFSSSELHRKISHAFVKRAIESLKAFGDSRNLAKQQQIDDLPTRFERIAARKGGGHIYRVK